MTQEQAAANRVRANTMVRHWAYYTAYGFDALMHLDRVGGYTGIRAESGFIHPVQADYVTVTLALRHLGIESLGPWIQYEFGARRSEVRPCPRTLATAERFGVSASQVQQRGLRMLVQYLADGIARDAATLAEVGA